MEIILYFLVGSWVHGGRLCQLSLQYTNAANVIGINRIILIHSILPTDIITRIWNSNLFFFSDDCEETSVEISTIIHQ